MIFGLFSLSASVIAFVSPISLTSRAIIAYPSCNTKSYVSDIAKSTKHCSKLTRLSKCTKVYICLCIIYLYIVPTKG
jgi:hypothetical protein